MVDQRTPTGIAMTQTQVFGYRGVVFYFDHFREAEPAKKLISAILSSQGLSTRLLTDGSGERIEDEESAIDWFGRAVLPKYLSEFFLQVGTGTPENEAANCAFDRTVRPLLSPDLVVTCIAPMPGMAPLSEPLQLDSGVRIRQATNREIEDWMNDGHLDFIVLSSIEMVAEASVNDLRQNQQSATNAARSCLDDAITALRLVSGHPVPVPFMEGWANIVPMVKWSSAWRDRSQLCESFSLGPEQQSSMPTVFGKVRTASPSLKLPLRRWNESAQRSNPEDRLLDYWIALEALVTPESSSEVTYRAALRSAIIAGDDDEERVEIYDFIRKRSYDCRSKIVHGSCAKDVEEIAVRTGEILRRIILRAFDRGLDPRNIECTLLRRD